MCILKDFIILGKNITMKILKFPVHFQFIWYKIIHLFWFGVSEIFIFIMVWSVSHKKETLHVTSQYPFEKWDVHSWRCRYPVLLYPVLWLPLLVHPSLLRLDFCVQIFPPSLSQLQGRVSKGRGTGSIWCGHILVLPLSRILRGRGLEEVYSIVCEIVLHFDVNLGGGN